MHERPVTKRMLRSRQRAAEDEVEREETERATQAEHAEWYAVGVLSGVMGLAGLAALAIASKRRHGDNSGLFAR